MIRLRVSGRRKMSMETSKTKVVDLDEIRRTGFWWVSVIF
jgi:hypothetical protein